MPGIPRTIVWKNKSVNLNSLSGGEVVLHSGTVFTQFKRVKKGPPMENLLSLTAFILFVSWLIGIMAFGAGPIIHILLVFAFIALVLRSLRRDEA
jgi:hypothetical protein